VLFELIKGLIKDLDETNAEELDEEDFQEEQNSVARLIHMLDNEEPEEMLKVKHHKFTKATCSLNLNMPFIRGTVNLSLLLHFTQNTLLPPCSTTMKRSASVC
jgi:hypothetical protein